MIEETHNEKKKKQLKEDDKVGTNSKSQEDQGLSLEEELKDLRANGSLLKGIEIGRGLTFLLVANPEAEKPKENEEKEEEKVEKEEEKKVEEEKVEETSYETIDPVEIVKKLVHQIESSGEERSTVISRVVPIQHICNAMLPDLKALMSTMFSKYLASKKESPEKLTFAIEFKRRYNDTLKRDDVIETIGDLVTESCKSKNIELRANLSSPDVCILIEVCKSVVGVSIMEQFASLHKLNIKTAASHKSKLQPTDKTT